MKLEDKEKELIAKEIENIEKLSSTELIAVVTKRSGDYKLASCMLSVLLLFVVSFLYLIFVEEPLINKLIEIQFATFVGFYLFFEKYKTLLLSIIPRQYKQKIASQNGHKQFINLKLNKTKSRQTIMFFVSFDEKYVEIITDEEISKLIPKSHWQLIIDELIVDVKNQQLMKGYLKAIKACSSILIEKFPANGNNENELSNEVIELQ